MTTPDADRAAAILRDAWTRGIQLDALPADLRPSTVDDGYDIQDRLVALLDDEVVGWKLGVGSIKGRRDSGLGRSVAGRVVRSRLFAAGDAVPIALSGPVTIEFETGFMLARTVMPGDDVSDLDGLIAEARLTCEFVRSRFVDRRAVGWASFAADDAGFDALVVGPAFDRAAIAEAMRTLVVTVDGVERVRAVHGDDVTDPVGAFRDFLGLAAERRMTVPRGAVVSTGTMSVPFPIDRPAAIEARSSIASLSFTTTC